jgi:hypothetical protein
MSLRPSVIDHEERIVSDKVVSMILARTLRDRAFAAQLKMAPNDVLAAFDLTDDERASIMAGLHSAGGGASLDQRPRIAGRIV